MSIHNRLTNYICKNKKKKKQNNTAAERIVFIENGR